MIQQPTYAYFGVLGFILQQAQSFALVLLIALAVYLFSKAVDFEKAMEVETPDKVAQNNQIEEIREQVDHMHS